jgi:hypothetical protein
MQTADWALIISIGSLVIASASFIWNIWAKFIYPKPTVRVHFAMLTIMHPHGSSEDDYEVLSLSATNMGPIETTLRKAFVLHQQNWFASKRYGILNTLPSLPHDADHLDHMASTPSGPFAAGLPKKLAVGEEFTVYFIPDHEDLARGDYERIGFDDSFGGEHWAPRQNILAALPYIREACEKTGKDWRAKRK